MQFNSGIKGTILVLTEPLSFYGGVDPDTGKIIQNNHPQSGENISGKILMLPYSTGSTVGSWSILRLKENNCAPAAFMVSVKDPVLAAGSVLAEIPYIAGFEPDISLNGSTACFKDPGEIYVGTGKTGFLLRQKSSVKPDFTLKKSNLTVIKLGGSVITDKKSDIPVFNRINAEKTAEVLSDVQEPVVLVHGAGSFGHAFVEKHNLLNRELTAETKILWSELQSLQYELNNKINEVFRNCGLAVFPVQASAFFDPHDTKLPLQPLNIVENLVNQGFIPIMYGTPAVYDSNPYILSGDTLVTAAAVSLNASRVIYLTDVDGIYKSFPPANNEKPVKSISARDFSFKISEFLDFSRPDVTNSMFGKFEEALKTAEAGIPVHIINGLYPHRIIDVLNGKTPGTLITK